MTVQSNSSQSLFSNPPLSKALADRSSEMNRGQLIATLLVACLTLAIASVSSDASALAESGAKSQLGPRDGQQMPATDLERVQVGDAAPRFRLPSSSGDTFDLEETVKKGHVVLVFYRGHWCSACARELAEMAREVHAKAPRVPIYAISTDTIGESQELAELIESSGYPTQSLFFLEDDRHRVIDRYGVLNTAAGDTAYRAVFVLDEQGLVVWRAVEDGHQHDNETMVVDLLKQLEKRTKGS